MTSPMKYPWQITAVKRNKKVLGVDAQLYTPPATDSPLEMHSGFSRFILTILDGSRGESPVPHKANINVHDVAMIRFKTECAMRNMMERPNPAAAGSSVSADVPGDVAYTVKLLDKAYRGKTPAEVLIANPAEKDGLLRTRGWLESNLGKYPSNASQIEAIDQAIQLLAIGELAPVSGTASITGMTIYETEYKFFTTKNDKGYNAIYQISVICDPEKNYPFVVSVTNGFAPVETLPDGRKNIKISAAEGITKASMSLSDAEWYGVVDRMAATKQQFEEMHFKAQFDIAQDNAFKPNNA